MGSKSNHKLKIVQETVTRNAKKTIQTLKKVKTATQMGVVGNGPSKTKHSSGSQPKKVIKLNIISYSFNTVFCSMFGRFHEIQIKVPQTETKVVYFNFFTLPPPPKMTPKKIFFRHWERINGISIEING